MKTPDGILWCDECKYQISKNVVTEGKLHFCNDICREIYLGERGIPPYQWRTEEEQKRLDDMVERDNIRRLQKTVADAQKELREAQLKRQNRVMSS